MRHCRPSRSSLYLFAVTATFSLFGVSGTLAQDKSDAGKPAPVQWSKQCAKDGSGTVEKTQRSACAATYVIRDKRGRQIVSLMATRLKNNPYLEVVVPLGIFLPFGVRVQVDKEKPFQTKLVDCLQAGCRAFSQLDKAQLAALRSGKFIKIIFKDSKSQKALAVTGTLRGFGTAFSS